MEVKYKIKILEIYFDEKCYLSDCTETRDYNMLLSLYPYLQDNDSCLFSNSILNQIQTSKKRMSLIGTLFLTSDEIFTL